MVHEYRMCFKKEISPFQQVAANGIHLAPRDTSTPCPGDQNKTESHGGAITGFYIIHPSKPLKKTHRHDMLLLLLF